MRDEELSEADVAAIKALIPNTSLASIDYYELSASRLDLEQPADGAGEENLTISIEYRGVTKGSFGVRLRAEVVLPHGRARACVAGEYIIDESYEPDERACMLYVNEVAVMMVYPYLREAMATASGRVFAEPVHLPLIERGQLTIDLSEEE